MFLANLTGNQKKAFLSLARKLIEADGLLQKDELSTLEQYKREMNLVADFAAEEETFEEAISVFQAEARTVKKQIVFELLALACSDREYAKEEGNLLEKIRVSFDLEEKFFIQSKAYIRELISLYDNIGVLIG